MLIVVFAHSESELFLYWRIALLTPPASRIVTVTFISANGSSSLLSFGKFARLEKVGTLVSMTVKLNVWLEFTFPAESLI